MRSTNTIFKMLLKAHEKGDPAMWSSSFLQSANFNGLSDPGTWTTSDQSRHQRTYVPSGMSLLNFLIFWTVCFRTFSHCVVACFQVQETTIT